MSTTTILASPEAKANIILNCQGSIALVDKMMVKSSFRMQEKIVSI
jgi:hypothetical protein